MTVYIGIDVGGTFTDAVLLNKGSVRSWTKVATRREDLLSTLLEALDCIMKETPAELINRVALSTTMITNLIVEKKYDPVGLILMPGPGFVHDYYRSYKTDTHVISGVIDYRGREIVPLDDEEIYNAISKLDKAGYKKVAVVGKFCCRNSSQEKYVAKMIKKYRPDWQVEMGHTVAGQLNYPRRVVSTLLTCATREKYQFFLNSVKTALEKRNITTPVFILKADGGTLPLEKSKDFPIETIFSGPVASTLGVQALLPPGETAVTVDIGGTTSDLALIVSGQPLLSRRGAIVNDQLTHVRALAVKSVPVGGDSIVELVGKEIIVYSERLGSPYCLGGPMPTPTDALRILGLSNMGDYDKALEAMNSIGRPLGISPIEVATKIIFLVVDLIVSEIELMYEEWEQNPLYRVWEVLQNKKIRPQLIVGVGGSASGFVTQVASKMNCYSVIPPYAKVANAIGAAVARPTLQVSLRADTQRGIYSILEEGYQGTLEDEYFNEEEALELAKKWLKKRSYDYGLELTDELGDIEVIRKESFNMVREWITVGKLYDISMQTKRGILHYIGKEVDCKSEY